MIKILFFTPTGGESGSEILISRMVTMLNQSEFESELFVENGCIKKVKGFSKVHNNPFNENKKIVKIWNKLKNSITKRVYENKILAIHKKLKPDFWYINTVLMSHISDIAKKNKIPFVSHYHELPHIHFELTKYSHLKTMVEDSILNIGNANCTCEVLKTMGAQNIQRIYPFISGKIWDEPILNSKKIRSLLQIPQEAFVWVISGAVTYAKGVELLPLIAKQFNSCHFVWIGGNTDSGSFYYTQKVVATLPNVHLVGSKKEDYFDYFSCGNGLLLLSLEESFGLVVLESAQLGIPTVAINAGGVSEILIEGMGTIVPKMEIKSLFKAMIETMSNISVFDPEISKNRLKHFDQKTEMKIWESNLRKLITTT